VFWFISSQEQWKEVDLKVKCPHNRGQTLVGGERQLREKRKFFGTKGQTGKNGQYTSQPHNQQDYDAFSISQKSQKERLIPAVILVGVPRTGGRYS